MIIGVTGARGMVGRRLVEQLTAQGRAVSLFAGDIRDGRSASEWVSASPSRRRRSSRRHRRGGSGRANPVETFRTNVVGTINLMRALERAAHPCWVFSFVFRPRLRRERRSDRRDTSVPVPEASTGKANFSASQDGASLCRRWPDPALYWAGCSSLYDPEQTGSYLYPFVAARLRAHEGAGPLEIRDGDAVRDFSSAGEIAARIAALLRVRAEGVVNIGAGRSQTRDCADPVVVRRRGGFRGDANWPDQFGRGRYFQAQETSRWRRLAWRS